MAKIFQIVKRVAQAGFSSANTTVQVRPAPSIATVVNGTVRADIAPGVAISQAPTGAVSIVRPAPALTPQVSGSALADVAPAPQLQTVMTLQAVPVAPGPQLSTYLNLAGTYGAESATNVVEAGTAWSNPGNAVGTHNGTMASHPGAVSAQTSRLHFQFPNFPNKTGLTITAAKLRFYARQGGTALNNGGLQYYRGTAAVPNQTLLASFDANVDHTTTPYEVDLFALGYTTFASLDDLGAAIRGTLAGGAVSVTQDADAVELVVTANA